MTIADKPESPADAGRTTGEPVTRPELCEAASGALQAAGAQLRDYARSRTRDRLLLDVLAVDLAAVADWLDRRAWLLSVDPAELPRQLHALAPLDVMADDELVPLDSGPAVGEGEAAAGPGCPAGVGCTRRPRLGPHAVSGLLHDAARQAVVEASTFRQEDYPLRVIEAAAGMVASWWACAGGYGVPRDQPELAELPGAALDALAAVDHARWAGHR